MTEIQNTCKMEAIIMTKSFHMNCSLEKIPRKKGLEIVVKEIQLIFI